MVLVSDLPQLIAQQRSDTKMPKRRALLISKCHFLVRGIVNLIPIADPPTYFVIQWNEVDAAVV